MSEQETGARAASALAGQLLLCIAATLLAAAPWLRSFPADVGAVPLFGAAGLSVALAALTARRHLLIAVALDLVGLIVYSLVVVLREPTGFAALRDGVVHGPSQLLTFALPLVSPRSLMVGPVGLTWLAGAVAGLCVARRWMSALPILGLLTAFGLAYAATQRAETGGGELREVLLGGGLLLCVLLLRAVQVWSRSELPLRGLASACAGALAVAVLAALVVQAPTFPTRAVTPQRAPTIRGTSPLSPVAFVAGLRPATPRAAGEPVFRVSTNASVPGYLSIANVDYYDGAGWSFDRTFRPSGGLIPADTDSALRSGTAVEQSYHIDGRALGASPWLPYLARPAKVIGTDVDVDAASGMIVPAQALSDDSSYEIRSTVPASTFDQVDAATASADTATPAADIQLPATLRSTLASIVTALATETGVSSSAPLPFLLALEKDLRTHYALVGGSSDAAGERAGSTGFADVLASILGPQRTATPEQYATLVVLVARELGIPARMATGFRATPHDGRSELTPGSHQITTGEAWTWAEVAISGIGWVVLDPSPSTFRTPAQDAPSAAASSATPTALPTQNALVTSANDGHAVAKASRVHHQSSATNDAALVIGLVLIGLLVVLVVAFLLLRKRIRARRRRRLDDPRARVSAAWQEALDLLYESGLAGAGELDPLTSTEISARVAARYSSDTASHVTTVGSAAESATFHTAVLVQDDTAELAWQAQVELRRALRAETTVRQRLRTMLRYYRRPRRH